MIEGLVIDDEPFLSSQSLRSFFNIKGLASPLRGSGFYETLSEKLLHSSWARAMSVGFIPRYDAFVGLISSLSLNRRLTKKSGFFHRGW